MYCAAVIGLGWMGLLYELAVACGAKGIVTEKPMAHTLTEVDRMVGACAEVPLCCGAITTNHPSFAKAIIAAMDTIESD